MSTVKKSTAKSNSTKKDLRAAKLTPGELLKLTSASLASLQVNIFIANRDFEIVYINDCAMQTLATIAGAIRQAFGVEIAEILGSSIHKFHRDPQQVEKLLTNADSLPHRAEFSFGPITLEADQ